MNGDDVADVAAILRRTIDVAKVTRGGPAFGERFGGLDTPDTLGKVLTGLGTTYPGLVALLNGVTLGLCLWNDENGIRTVDLLFVEEEAREVGLGTALLQEAENSAKEKGLRRFEVLALPGDRFTKGRAESIGMKARLLVLSKELEDV